MAVRYSQYMTNLNGEMWKVDILDSDHTGSVSEFILQDFELKYKSLTNRWDLLWGSECSVSMVSNSDFDLDDLIDDIIDAEEGRFQLVLYKKDSPGASWEFEWLGLVLNDLSGGSDELPQFYTISATDGMAALKGIDFSIDSVTPVPEQTVAEHLFFCLKKLPTADFFSSSDDFLKTVCNYYEGHNPNTSGDVLNWINLPATVFYEINENGVYKFMNCYEVIETICNLLYCRLSFFNGCWHFFNVRDLETQLSLTIRTYLFDESLVSGSVSESIRYTITGTEAGTRLAGQQFEFLPPLWKVERTFEHDTSRNLIQGLTINTSTANQLVISGVRENGRAYLSISGVLLFTASENPVTTTTKQIYVKVRLKLSIGGYQLKRPIAQDSENHDFTNISWGGSTDYVEFIGVFTSTVQGQGTLAINFDAPVFPNFTSSDLYIQLEKVYIQDLSGTSIASSYNYSANFQSIYIEYVDGEAENERLYYTENSTTQFFTEVAELDSLKVGDKINEMTLNRLKVWDGSAYVDSDGKWGRGTIAGTTDLIQLVLNDIMAGQRKTLRKRQGVFRGSFQPFNVLVLNSKFLVPLDVSFSCADAQFSGEWYQVGTYNDSGMSTGVVVQTIQNNTMPPSVYSGNTNTNLSARGVPLPTMTSTDVLELQNVASGTMMYLSDTEQIAIYTDRWESVTGEPIGEE